LHAWKRWQVRYELPHRKDVPKIQKEYGMGQIIWISGMATAMAVIWTVSSGELEPTASESYATAYVEPDIGEPIALDQSVTGSALAAAAFGMSALQPETYNGELVLDIINASHLAFDKKVKLAADIQAAEAGQTDLARVLSSVRVELAVD